MAEPGQRAEIMRALLDEMRRSLAIDVEYFREDFDSLQRASEERLKDPWRLPSPRMPLTTTVRPGPSLPVARSLFMPR
ncbi:hypothetical protein ABZU32_34230 [Sphaerisporangium sp. NPDC005288]|uniref:hypothetical protein n=1 Tax=Sphaerisporangium sp. NPDC005288 TaxID=3155114 RepID=UPI0033B1A060